MKALFVIVSATWKFAATFPLAIYIIKMSFWETILYTNIGGLIGIISSVFLSKIIIHFWDAFGLQRLKFRKKNRRVFRKRNRYLVILRKKFGLPGIVILTPVILSIPVGTFLTTKYFGKYNRNYLFLFFGQFAWSIIFTSIYMNI